MADTTDIEKKSLEAHVELCAERYRHLELKLENLDSDVGSVKSLAKEIHATVTKMDDRRNTQIIGWGMGLIGLLVATVGYLISHYVLK
jgi:hypothetical protein